MKYHTKNYKDVLNELNSSLSGLSNKEANDRLKKDGYNELNNNKKNNLLILLLKQFKEIMLLVLIIAGIISIILKEYSDAIIIFIVVIMNALLNFFQEYKAEKEVENLKKLATL